MTSEYAKRLAFAARKATGRQEFLASFLNEYQQQEALSDTEFFDFLGCTAESYCQLALCLTPDLQADDFGQRIERIARSVGASAPNLAQLVRRVAAVRSWGRTATVGQGAPANVEQPLSVKRPAMGWAHRPLDAMLLAARDRDSQETMESDSAVDEKQESDKQ